MMKKRLVMLVLVSVLMVVSLAACNRPATTASVNTPAGNTQATFPVGNKPTIIKDLATQTAQAQTTSVVPTPGTGETVIPPLATQAAPTTAPTATVAVIVPTATPGRPTTYTVQEGDHYICLARRYNLDLNAFFELNGLTMDSKAVTGKVLQLPQSGSWSDSFGPRALIAHPDTYTVKSGDTVNKIACAYGDVDPNAIIYANKLQSPYTLTAGQTLQIP